MKEIKIGVVSTYPEMSELMTAIAKEMNLDLEVREGVLEEGVSLAHQFEQEGVEVIISRGVTGKKIRKAVSLPVVLIEVTSFDILEALYVAKGMGRKIAFLGHKTKDFSLKFKTIVEILGIEVDCYPYTNINEMDEQVNKILGLDYDAVVSTGLCVYDMAKKSGANAVLVQSGYDAIYGSIKQAAELVQGIRREQERLKRYQAVLETSNDGILIVDEHKRLTFINKAAENLLDVNARTILGRHVSNIREPAVLGVISNGDIGDKEIFKEVGRKHFSIISMPIYLGSKRKGIVTMFQDSDKIQVLEQNLRRQLFKKGLFAKHTFDDIIGTSDAIMDTINRAKKYAAANATVLICGESGTGKELFAQSIHNESERQKGPFVAVNCAALPENLLESELFGYEEGAFTGAKKGGKIGLFEMAHGGTIFLDEIGEMTLPVQARLLRVIQEREIMRLGSDRVLPVDVRIIAATNHELIVAVKEGKFRSDLYHRLEVLNLDIPPLRKRKEDIEILAKHMINEFSLQEKKIVPPLTPAALEKLKKYDWPGNIRELQNVMQKYVLLIEKDRDVAELITKLINEKIKKSYAAPSGDENTINIKIGKMEDMEREIIEYLLSTGASIKEISQITGTSRTTLWRKLKDVDGAIFGGSK
ncbi:sigma 54-interacting transcriptional regulator [Desulfallas thermosapovorans]|uniref:PAS domain S-box-containing protein n=1 Tax=Desulfallas thermosapovorans DSM 6562 TaxID=1121431 RepID=A0A5S4ZT98_9FIRM|nr:sigma 54-interacting transcriptional regulator [Desulfallas thermosapovorans]TYO96182.1 PAS domain S-box-containing protein [Desulfallas thermosapovorans DSM 6562]